MIQNQDDYAELIEHELKALGSIYDNLYKILYEQR